MAFQEQSYPRRKNFIKNINILLEAKPIPSPQKSLAFKLLNQNSTTHTGVKTERVKESYNIAKVIKDNQLLPKRKLQLKVANQQNKLKKKQSFIVRYSKSAHQINKQTNKQLNSFSPSQQTINRGIINTQGSPSNKIRMILNSRNNQQFEISKSSQLSNRAHYYEKDKDLYQSIQIKRNSQGLLYDYKPKQMIKKQFLKKGHRIKTNIIQNLIKSKLLKRYQQFSPLKNQHKIREEEERVQNREIIKFIKLFKGTYLYQAELRLRNSSKFEPTIPEQEIKVKQKDSLNLQGWLNQSLQYQEHDLQRNLKQKALCQDISKART